MTVMRADSRTARAAPRNKAESADLASLVSPVMEPSPSPIIGDISGATSIAPMMTAGELVIRPIVAMLHDNTTSTKKSMPGEALSVTSSMISLRS